MTTANTRTSDFPIDSLFLERWSPRAYTGEKMTEAELMTLFEAARWAPSSYNAQPWRFIYAHRETASWEKFLGLLVPGNQAWVKNAAVLIYVASNSLMQPRGTDKPVPSYTHSFDAGAAWALLALQSTLSGFQAHGMVGFDKERAFAELGLPQGYRVEAAIAVGRVGDRSTLPEGLRAREQPSQRNPVSSFAFEGGFPAG